MHRLGNQRGFLHLGGIVFILALIGAWYVYRSYQEKQLVHNIGVVFADYKNGARSLVTSPADQAKLDQAFAQVDAIVAKYKQIPALPAGLGAKP